MNLLVFDFISDRLRSIRQDLIVQGDPDITISRKVLEYSTRFHILASYKLGSHPVERGFDKEQNFKQLLECLKSLLTFYESNENASEFIGIYLMLNLGSTGKIEMKITNFFKCKLINVQF